MKGGVVKLNNFAESRVILLEGDIGSGKSRLLHEFKQILAEEDVPIFTGSSEQVKMTTPYHVWQHIFEDVLQEDGKVKKFPELKDDSIPLLNAVIPGLNLPETPRIQQMTAQMRSESTQMLLVNILRRIVGPGSVIILDNAHWLDSASWALTVAVRQQIPGILIILALRKMGDKVPFELNQLMHHSGTTNISLSNLTESESALFIQQVREVFWREILMV